MDSLQAGARRDRTLTVASNLVISGCGVLSGLIAARALGAHDRGIYAFLWSCFWICFVLSELGIPYALCHFAAKTPPAALRTWRRGLALEIPSTALISLVAILVAAFKSGPYVVPALAAVVCIPVSVACNSIIAVLMGIDGVRWNVARLVQPGCYLLLLVVLNSDLTITSATVSLLASQLASLVTSSAIFFGMREGAKSSSVADRRGFALYGFAAFFSTLPAVTTARLDQIVLGTAGYTAQLGVYAVAVTIGAAMLPVAQALGAASLRLLPRLSESEGGWGSHARSARTVAILAGTVTVILGLVSQEVAVPALGGGFAQLGTYVLLLAPASAGLAYTRVAGDIFRGLGRPNVAATVDVCGMAATVLGVLAIVPAFGATAACVVSSVVAVGCGAAMSHRLGKLGQPDRGLVSA